MTAAPLLIAGFHRSGTSAVARSLHSAGLHLGDDLLGAEPANPYGHFEDLHVIEAHDAALERAGLTWKSPTETASMHDAQLRSRIEALVTARSSPDRPWGIKDPRLCLFLRDWLEVVPAANVIVVFRRPGDAIASLHRRHVRRLVDTRAADPSDRSFWKIPDLGLRLWIHYYEQLLEQLPAPEQVVAVDFANRQAIDALPQTLRAMWNIPLTTTELVRLDPSLGGTSSRQVEVRDNALIPRASQIWDRLSAITPMQM